MVGSTNGVNSGCLNSPPASGLGDLLPHCPSKLPRKSMYCLCIVMRICLTCQPNPQGKWITGYWNVGKNITTNSNPKFFSSFSMVVSVRILHLLANIRHQRVYVKYKQAPNRAGQRCCLRKTTPRNYLCLENLIRPELLQLSTGSPK